MEKLVFDKKEEFAIKFSWEDEEPTWLNFKAVEVVSDYTNTEKPEFITFDTGRGVNSDCTEIEDVEEDDLFFKGFIKWDGCMEIHELNHHFCYRSDILQRAVDLIYDSAKEIMKDKSDFD
jgi:hypothetical protein